MPKNLTDVSTFTDPIVVPVGGDLRNAESVEVGFQGLSNRTKYINDIIISGVTRIRQAADATAVRAITPHVAGDVVATADGRLYEYSTTVTTADDGVLIIKPNDVGGGSPGRWVNPARALLSAASVPFTGSVSIGNGLSVTGAISATGGISSGSNMLAAGNLTVGGLIDGNSLDIDTNATIGGNIVAGGNLTCVGVTASGTVACNTLTASNDVSVADDLTVGDASTFGGAATFNGQVTIDNDLVGGLTLAGETGLDCNGIMVVNGNAFFNNPVFCEKPIVLSDSATIHYRVTTGADADTTYSIADYDIILIKYDTLSATRDYTLSSSGVSDGSVITFLSESPSFAVNVHYTDVNYVLIKAESGLMQGVTFVYFDGDWRVLNRSYV